MDMKTLLSTSLLGAFAFAGSAMAATPTASQEVIYKALSVRDPAPVCAAVEALSETPVADLQFVVNNAAQPPWAGMRAAACLIRGHGGEIQSTLESWVSDDEKLGLAILVLNSVDTLPLDVAVSVAQKALDGPYAAEAKKRLPKSDSPEIQALVK
jgi:hypothetical protein